MNEKKKSCYVCSETGMTRHRAGTIFAVIYFLLIALLVSNCAKNSFYDPSIGDPLKVNIESIVPYNHADSVFVDPIIRVIFKPDIDPAIVSSATIILKTGSTTIPGSINISGYTASFSTDDDLTPDTEYSVTVKTSPKIITNLNETHEYSWKFKTGKSHRISTLLVLSVSPVDKEATVSLNSPLSVSFNQELSTSMKNSTAITLKTGTTNVKGSITYSGSSATFQPDADLEANKLYTGKVAIGASNNFTWSFTTAPIPDISVPTVLSVAPAVNATAVAVSIKPAVTFSEPMNASTINAATFTLKQGSTSIPGAVSCSGATAIFTPASSLTANTTYTGTITTGAQDAAGNTLATAYVWSFTTAPVIDNTAPTVLSVVPVNASINASTTTKATVTFSEPMNPATINPTTFTLKQGSVSVAGTVNYSGSSATFTPTNALTGNTTYTVTVTTAAKDVAGNALASNYTWSFTTAAAADVTAPTILSVTPVSNATSVAVSTKPAVTFSEVMDATTITALTFTLKQGTTIVPGSVTYTGTTATFTPASTLAGSTVYTGAITTGVKDASGNAIASSYSWSFTTAVVADVTPPTIVSVVPASNAISVGVSSNVMVTFSEAMNSSTITSSTFTFKQGSTVITGNVSYSGTTATFTPSSALTGNTVYTAAITTGCKDVAGNAVASNYSWSFTTVATTPAGKSFASDIVPILNLCNTCHTHPWTVSSNASTFYTNLVNGGYVNTANPTSSKIYTKLNGGHPPGSTISAAQKTTVLTWFTEGAKNN